MLDIKGAFDHAHHPTLIIALYNKGCPIILIKLIFNFLTNRKACFYLNGSTLSTPVTKGCPQGSILSPLLWNVYVDEIFRLPLPSGMRIFGFADHIAIWKTEANVVNLQQNLQKAIDSILQWGKKQRLTFSENKTEMIIFTRKRNQNGTKSVDNFKRQTNHAS